jgi:hypothetical protein
LAETQINKTAGAGTQKNAMLQEMQARIEFGEKLKHVAFQIHSAKNVTEILVKMSPKILHLFNADRITIYSLDTVKRQL